MMDFSTFFKAIHSQAPFPWQATLAGRVLAEGRWPKLIDLPTASGKTACIDIAVWAMACEATKPPAERRMPRRVWFVVDRRIVVDEAARRAETIQKALRENDELAEVRRALLDLRGVRDDGGLPLAVARLRGGGTAPANESDEMRTDRLRVEAHNESWQTVPTQPAVLLSTVDQLGSRLLFRGYGMSSGMWPIHAALAGNDSLILLDEAHIAEPLRQTLGWVARHRRTAEQAIPTPWHVAFMTATPGEPDEGDEWPVFPSPAERADALRHDLLDQRRDASKRATLLTIPGDKRDEKALSELVVKRVGELLDAGRRRVAVMLNRVDSATSVSEALAEKFKKDEDKPAIDLLTGRMRPIDRAEAVGDLAEVFAANRKYENDADGPRRVLVTTQCLEVGADFDFDGLVTECASLDALRQRFGRLDRLGEFKQTDAAIITVAPDAKEPDPIYGEGLANTHAWLRKVAEDNVVDFGIAALDAKLDPSQVQPLLGPKPNAPVLMPAYLDAWCQTGPRPAVEAEVSLFLHGIQDDVAEVSVVFRGDLPDSLRQNELEEVVRLCPPARGEMLPVKLGRLRAWLTNTKLPAEGDAGGIEDKATLSKAKDVPPPNKIVRYRGGRKTEVKVLRDWQKIRAGDVLVVPLAGDVMPMALGIKPEKAKLDLFEAGHAAAGLRPIRRLTPSVLAPVNADEEARVKAVADAAEAARLVGIIARSADTVVDETGESDAKRRAARDLAALLPGWPMPRRPVRSGGWQYLPHPAGGAIVLGPPHKRPPMVDPFADTDDLLGAPRKATVADRQLDAHQGRVTFFADESARKCVPDHRRQIADSARHHDDGKADPRFQGLLAGSVLPIELLDRTNLLAKSEGRRPPKLESWYRERLGLPKGFAHEMLSVQLRQKAGESDDLILHLIGSHHADCRPFPRVVIDDDPPDVRLDGVELVHPDPGDPKVPHERNDPAPHAFGSGVAERFWRLTRRHGWWGLAYLEAMLRLADQHASRFPADDAREEDHA